MTATDRLHAEILGSMKTNYGAQSMPCPVCGAHFSIAAGADWPVRA